MNRDVHVTTAHLPGRRYPWKKWLIRTVIVIIVVVVLIYPYEIGQFIGNWYNEFANGIKLK